MKGGESNASATFWGVMALFSGLRLRVGQSHFFLIVTIVASCYAMAEISQTPALHQLSTTWPYLSKHEADSTLEGLTRNATTLCRRALEQDPLWVSNLWFLKVFCPFLPKSFEQVYLFKS